MISERRSASKVIILFYNPFLLHYFIIQPTKERFSYSKIGRGQEKTSIILFTWSFTLNFVTLYFDISNWNRNLKKNFVVDIFLKIIGSIPTPVSEPNWSPHPNLSIQAFIFGLSFKLAWPQLVVKSLFKNEKGVGSSSV